MPAAATTASALRRLFHPRAIAIVGASAREGSINSLPLEYLRRHRYRGAIYPVNPRYEQIAGYRCYPDLDAVPGPVDVALIALPAAQVPPVIEACGRKGVAVAMVFSAGFAELGGEGRVAQGQLIEVARRAGVRLIGPNCIGSVNVTEGIPLGFAYPLGLDYIPGSIGFASQSGAYTYSIFSVAQEMGLGFHLIANTGNEADIDWIDCLDYMLDDGAIDTLVAYAEGVPDGRRLLQLARRAAELQKPVVVLRAGRSPVGQEAVASHTAALSGSQETFRSVARHAGLIVVDDADEMTDALMVMSRRKLPRGRRVGIVATAGDAAALTADRCAHYGLEAAGVPAAMAVDDPEGVPAAVSALLERSDVDAAAVVVSGVTGEAVRRVCQAVAEAAGRTDRPVLVSLLGGRDGVEPGLAVLRQSRVPYFRTPASMARALASLARYAAFLGQFRAHRPGWARALDGEQPPPPDGELLERLETEGVTEGVSKALVARAGIPVPLGETVEDVGAAVAVAERVGFPVAVKAESPDVLHKTEAGAVLLNIGNRAQLESAFAEVQNRVRNYRAGVRLRGVRVEAMAPPGVEVICGARWDVTFGPTVLFGTGGINVELFRDVAIRPAPLTREEALAMVDEVKGSVLLRGFRGRPAADVEAVADILVRLSRLIAGAEGRIAEIDLNPVIVHGTGAGAVSVDALVVPAGQQGAGSEAGPGDEDRHTGGVAAPDST